MQRSTTLVEYQNLRPRRDIYGGSSYNKTHRYWKIVNAVAGAGLKTLHPAVDRIQLNFTSLTG